ncbi:cell division protein FtsQ/DivIB [Aeromicrobium sp. CTD01-1L150]|uniref:cell division protein FtsQ/DivIB n=1 Tax=Aeromicrobium sp. CTD01-1L150 TaxID=3341830 RepID=UPI0035C23F79
MSQQRFEQKRRQDRRRKLLRYVLPATMVVAGAGLLWLVVFSSVLAVSSVKVEGLDTLKAGQVREAAEVPDKRPLARLDTVAIEGRVGSMERVENVEVHRSWPSTVRIVVTERRPVAWVRLDGRMRAIDRYGVDFKTYRREPKTIVEVRFPGMDARRLQQSLSSAGSVLAALRADDPALLKAVQHVEVESRDSVVLALSRGRTVTWGSAGRTAEKLTVLRSLLEAVDASGYDVSAPEQPTTKS